MGRRIGSRRTTTWQRRGLQPADRPAVKQITAGAERNEPKTGRAVPEVSLRLAVEYGDRLESQLPFHDDTALEDFGAFTC